MSEPARKPRMEIIPPQKGGEALFPAPPRRAQPQPISGPFRRQRPGPLRRALAYFPGVPTIVGLYFYLMDEDAPFKHRLAIGASLLYLINPLDLIKEILIPFGFVDDIAVLTGLVMFLGSENLKPYRQKAKKWLREGIEE